MKEPTSRYGCGSEDCTACYGDREWRAERTNEFLSEIDEPGLERDDFYNPYEDDYLRDEEAGIQAAEDRYEKYLDRMGGSE